MEGARGALIRRCVPPASPQSACWGEISSVKRERRDPQHGSQSHDLFELWENEGHFKLFMAAGSPTVEPNAARQMPIAMWVVAVFGCTSFLSAFLLFQVQLIISKYILPWFGGAASVWTTSLLVFQVLLLGGYAYTHLVSERLSNRAQSNLHLGLLTAAFLLVLALSLAWPSAITPGTGWKPLNSSNPVRDVIVILLLATGFPYFVLSTTAPLLQ